MLREYTELCHVCPRSFLFAVVANVGPGGESRSLAVAYRQGDDYIKETYLERVDHFVADTLALVEILSDPANRALLEAERALAQDWYWQQARIKNQFTPRPRVPDSVQPPYMPWKKQKECLQHRPQLPWRDNTEFPFTTTCLILGLLGGNRDGTKRSRTRPGDVQLQPLSTVFLGDCIEYGLVVLDISDLESGVKYGIAAFPIRYMADAQYKENSSGWDLVVDPAQEPNAVPFSPRPRELLSIRQWLSRYFHYDGLSNNPSLHHLDNMPLVGPAALDYIWPRKINLYMTKFKGSRRASWGDVICDIFKTFIWPSRRATRVKKRSTARSPAGMVGNTMLDDQSSDMSFDCAKDDSTTRASSITISDNQPRDIPEDIDHIINDLLVLTQEADEHLLKKSVVGNLQTLVKFPEQLREQLEEDPRRLGPFKVSSHVLAIAYAGRSHLNWAAFQNLTPSVIAAALASDELQSASALSLCANQFKLEGNEDFEELTAAISQCTGLRQLCILQQLNRDGDTSSACSYSQQLLLGHGNSIYATCAFSTSLRSRECLISSSTITRSLTSPHAHILPVMHIFMFGHCQGEDGPAVAADVQPYQNYYAMNNTLLDAETFAARFLAYLLSLSSDLDFEKAVLQFAYSGASSSSSGQLGAIPIPAGFFNYDPPPNNPSRARLSSIHPGSWVILVGSSEQIPGHAEPVADSPSDPCGPSPPNSACECHADTRQPSASIDRGRPTSRPSDDTGVADKTVFFQYSFVKIRQASAEIVEQHQQMPTLLPNRVEVVGGLTDFLHETAPESDIPTWEKRIGEMQMRLCTQQDSIGTGNRSIEIGVMAESRARALLNQLL